MGFHYYKRIIGIYPNKDSVSTEVETFIVWTGLTNVNFLLDLSLEVKMKKEIDVNRLWINEEITQKSGAKYVKQLCEFINEGKPIIIYLNSVGGDVDEGLAIVDLIEHAKSKGIDVTTVGISTSSMASFILFSGSPGHRYAYPSIRIMIHKPYYDDSSGLDKSIERAEINIATDKLIDILNKYGKVKKSDINKFMSKDYYMSATEAKKYKFIDKIGVLC